MRSFKVAFRCTGCGKCCTGKGGKVRVNAREVAAIADYLAISTEDCRRKYVGPVEFDGMDTLRQSADDSQCIFLDGKKCTIYPVRPTQCQTYPFWPQHLISKYDWSLVAKECEGVELNPREDGTDLVSNDKILHETVIHEVHQAGEELTYDEIASLVTELDRDLLEGFQDEVAAKYRREVVHTDDTVTVLDSFLDGATPTRSLYFVDRLDLVQSEVYLTSDHQIDHSRLALDVHRGLCRAFEFLQPSSPWNVAMIGAGAGVLPSFWRHNIPHPLTIHAIDPCQAVLDAGVRFFDLASTDGHVVVHHEMGESFLDRQPPGQLDLVVIDVEDGTQHGIGGSQTILLKAPPASMTSIDLFTKIHHLLKSSGGVVALNVIHTDSSDQHDALLAVSNQLKQAFDQVWMAPLPKNAVVLGIRGHNPPSPSTFSSSRAFQQAVSEIKLYQI
ncbi:hypothetical protein LEN26_014649 [Aphanomyces euteiches]|nr:hypothetical protein AeMF1_020437 [Aphanomyces euteiches]KAH9106117.1 hypothetical protein LEN26_014649 [Aphanomyces euteiches]KAH9195046.1 hypothetical protein AeNC1_002970 [Aphanomyces euteiches]